MNFLENVIDMIMSIASRIFNYADEILKAFVEGRNKYIIYAVFLYLIGVFGTAKFRLNLTKK